MQRFSSLQNWRRPSQADKPHDPVLTTEDEQFLQSVTAQPTEAEATLSLNGDENVRPPVDASSTEAYNIPLPISPVEEFKELGEEERKASNAGVVRTDSKLSHVESTSPSDKKKGIWSWLRRRGTSWKKKDKEPTAPAEPNASQSLQSSDPANSEAKQETDEMTEILERLNLAADNNRVFSISDETQELLRKFTLIFKDLINGVPTAYHDLEMLLSNGNKQLQQTYSQLPGFLQKLIEKLPERWTETLAPEVLAAASERASRSGLNVENVGKAAAAANKMGIKVPSLKELVGKPAAIVGMLRSIMAFLRARFPAVLGMNVLWSLALFILLFVLWYCHKRGREVRLENERLVTEEEISRLNEDSTDGRIRPTETLVTTAAPGASVAEIREGVKEAQQAGESATATAERGQDESTPTSALKPTRSKSILSMWPRSQTKPIPKVEPYPGT
ncbi:uncharacterized protein NFIA_064240 [Aspergillus fischeri NRRL 181]|uniref:Uncharacterized protein n=1 Tax=Neosartorya fischeri (strain ATCC 1020 / DSM 3700 / CBS 544.65 / FGSC A1164 / JCM 1740 / NRRL 181 / WB 181) TaxID=331117 RepID=A1D6B6_NEOFI|nr:conserved hypothetical protein [Aspergillus fischeri NRRL 181]EAW21260.1 conserved hypothetical protein [Aspergillus fischeri NRRL 181]KAG2014847.1 hypothetical protein GB937_006305 [Aspergillus fischeri]